jgi:hypothetical protein
VALVRTDVSDELSASFIRVASRSVRRLLVTAGVVPSSPILFTLMKEVLSSSETSVLTRATWRNIPEDTILPVWKFVSGNMCLLLLLAWLHLVCLTLQVREVVGCTVMTKSILFSPPHYLQGLLISLQNSPIYLHQTRG